MLQRLAGPIFQWKPITPGDVGTIAVALATILTLILSVRLARKSYRLTVTQINREDTTKIYATALAGLRASFVLEYWNLVQRGNEIAKTIGMPDQVAMVVLTNVFGSGIKIVLTSHPNDDVIIAETRSIEFQAKIDLLGNPVISDAFKICVQEFQEYSKEVNTQFWSIKGKETKEGLEAIQKDLTHQLFEIYRRFTSLESAMKSELTVAVKNPWYMRKVK